MQKLINAPQDLCRRVLRRLRRPPGEIVMLCETKISSPPSIDARHVAHDLAAAADTSRSMPDLSGSACSTPACPSRLYLAEADQWWPRLPPSMAGRNAVHRQELQAM